MEYRLLIVDDQQDLVAALRNQFFIRGYEVMSAGDGRAAIDMINGSSLDLILLDIEMPGISGLEVLKHVKKQMPEAKVIVMTGHDEYESVTQEIGADLFLAKPFTFDQLEKSISSLLANKGYEEVKQYSIHGQMKRAPKGASVADILLVEPIEMFAESISSFLSSEAKSGGYYHVYKVDTMARAVVLQSSLFIQIALVDLRTNQNPTAVIESLLNCERPPVALIHYLEPYQPIGSPILNRGEHWSGNPIQENDLKQLSEMIRKITLSNGLVKV